MQKSNFVFLEMKRPELYRLGVDAEGYAYSDPQSAIVKLRCFAELFVNYMYQALNITDQGVGNFNDKINHGPFKQAVERDVIDKLHFI